MSFESHLDRLFEELLEKPNSQPLDEPLLDTMNVVIKTVSKGVETGSTIYNIVQRYFGKIFLRNSSSITAFFISFHHWCYYGSKYVALNNDTLLTDMLRISFRALSTVNALNMKDNFIEYGRCCLILQMIIQCFTPNGALESELPELLEELAKAHNSLCKPDTKFLCARLYQTYYCLLACYPVETIEDLKKRNWLEPMFDEVLRNYLEYFNGDSLAKKIVVEAIGQLLLNVNPTSLNENGVIALFHVMFNLLRSNVKLPEAKQVLWSKTQLQEKENKCNEKLKMDHIETEGASRCEMEVIDYKLSPAIKDKEAKLKFTEVNMRYPFREKDEYYIFGKAFDFFKKNFPLIIENMVRNMKEDDRRALIHVLNSKVTDHENMIIRKIVKAVKKKEGM